MIRQSFLFLDKIRERTEKRIWGQGICSWDAFLQAKSVKGISGMRKGYYDRQIRKAQHELFRNNSEYFLRLPQREMWRLYEYFKGECVFLDIETSGMGAYDDVTVVGLYDGIDTKSMIKGINLNYYELKKELGKYKLLVTFNGASFDVPFIRKRYPDVIPKIPHFDLRVACQRVGLTGGLKEIEKTLGIKRNEVIEGMYGGDALLLWKMYRATGDKYYLRLLVEYNEEDVFNLKKIAEHVYKQLTLNSKG
jgi:uncharacterized protein YprB with RNaseH-like and TPR domain